LPNKAFEEVSEPVRKTPSHPRTGEKNGKRTPVLANAIAMVIDIPELLATNAKPTIDAIVIMVYFNCINVARKALIPFFKLIPIKGSDINADNTVAVPAVERKLNSKGLIFRKLPSGFKIAFCKPGI